jgi:hypothetical protein
MRPSRNGFEAPANLVERQQNAPGDPESGEARESQHPITMIRGVCPASAK